MCKAANRAVLVLLLAAPARAGLIDLGGVGDLIAQKTKEARGATLADGQRKVSGALYLPVWTLKDRTGMRYAHWGIGGRLRQGEHAEPFAIVALNLPALSGRLWDFQWARDHVERTAFPPIWVGPYIIPPYLTPGPWVIGRMMGGAVSIGLGGQ